jgi:uncharacterized membrane protein YjjP (DUF1212 family)
MYVSFCHADVHSFRISIGLIMSFTARGLSSINGNLFCYTAITSSSIIGILPGYLIRKGRICFNLYAKLTKGEQ